MEAELAKAKAAAKQASDDLTQARGELDAQKREIAALQEKETAASDALAKLRAQLKAAEDTAKAKVRVMCVCVCCVCLYCWYDLWMCWTIPP